MDDRPTPGADRSVAQLARCAELARSAGEPLADLAGLLESAAARLREPMRVAVAGQIKRGKSTLVNALLGRRIAVTGRLETTLTVCELGYGGQPEIAVHYRDSRPVERVPADRFAQLSTRAGGPAAAAVAKVEFTAPIPLLRRLRIVDTPGLGSVHGTDSADAARFLDIADLAEEADRSALTGLLSAAGRAAHEVHQDSAAQVASADAALFVFSRSLHERERAAVDSFTGPGAGGANPLTAIAVLSRCDEYWNPADGPAARSGDPMAQARVIAARHQGRAQVGRLFSAVLPVAGLVAEGAATLPAEAFTWLADLAGGFGPALVRELKDADWFARSEQLDGITLPAGHRRALIGGLGPWGVFRACELLHAGLGEQQVRATLIDDSGVTRLRELLVSQFGNRAALIKLDRGLRRAVAEISRRRADPGSGPGPGPGPGPGSAAAPGAGAQSAVLDQVAARLQDLRARTHGFAELDALARHYAGELDFTAGELDQLLRVTGEYGTHAAARVGLAPDASARAIEQAAADLARVWADRAEDPALGRGSVAAARTVLRGYERILDRARTARLLLETTDDSALDDPFDPDAFRTHVDHSPPFTEDRT